MGAKKKKKRVGFVDYRLDNFHANVYLKLLRGDLQKRGFTVAGCSALKQRSGQAWAAANEVPYFSDIAALNEAVDYFMVLAPSNPEVHLELCRLVFPFGKPTYVDKTFAPDRATAARIFALADRHGTAIQTTSALRYTNVQAHVAAVGGPDQVKHMVAWGGGGSFGEYAIHPVELVISCMGSGVRSLMRRGTGKQSQLLLDFTRRRTAVVNVYVQSQTPFAASVTTLAETKLIEVDGAALFRDTAAAQLDFFAAGQASIDRRESLMVRRVLDAAAQADAPKGFIPV